MGFQGQLASVNLADIFQTLAMNRQSGTLHVSGSQGAVLVHFDLGQIVAASAPQVDGKPFLIHALLRRGLLASDQAEELTGRLRTVAQPLRALLAASAFVPAEELDTVSAWCIEEQVCPLFTRTDGEFSFADGPIPEELQGPEAVEIGGAGLPATNIILEATRRRDEWKRIREVIPDDHALFIIDNAGRPNLKNVQTDPDMLKVVRYLDGRHSLATIARQVGVTQFDTFAIVAQLILAEVARQRTAQEIVDDAQLLMREGDHARAKEMLEVALASGRVAEVLRPLAECCTATQQAPRAVEIYLELIQMARDSGELDQALADLDRVIALSPDDPELYMDRGQVLADLGRGDDGSAAFCAAAQAYLATKDVAHAIDACHRAKNLVPRAPEPHRFLAKAYLLDGQTENAVVEYKALWHALLTTQSPRKALDELRLILTADCKFQAVKDQVLAHAQNSEAVKTGKVVRVVLISALAAGLLVGGWFAFDWWRTEQRLGDGHRVLVRLEGEFNQRKEVLAHPQLLDEVRRQRSAFIDLQQVADGLKRLGDTIERDYDRRASDLLAQAKALNDAGQFEKARALVARLRRDFRGASAAANADALALDIDRQQMDIRVGSVLREARRQWDADDWDGALARLRPLVDAKDLPREVATEINAIHLQWTTAIGSAEALAQRAERIERAGDTARTRAAFRRAAQGRGEEAVVARVRARLGDIERTLAGQLAGTVAAAAGKGLDREAFAALAELTQLARESENPQVADLLATLAIPFAVGVDHPATVLTISRSRGGERIGSAETVRAPAGTAGRWTHRLTYTPSETVSISAMRTGFISQPLTVAAQQRRSAASLILARGAAWRRDLGAVLTAPPLVEGNTALYGSNRGGMVAIDAVTGTERTLAVEDAVSGISIAPVIAGGRLYIGHEERLSGYDLAVRARRWVWPAAPVAGQRFTGALALHRSELVLDRMVVFAGVAGGHVAIIGVDRRDQVTPYPRLTLGQELTGAPLVERSGETTLLALPIGNELRLLDISLLTEVNPPVAAGIVRSRGDLIGRGVRVQLGERPAWLMCDASGTVLAVDLSGGREPRHRVLGAWPVDGTPTGQIAVTRDGASAFVATGDGRVVALDLGRPGRLLWRYPAQLPLTGMAAAPAVGQRSLFVADATQLHALDPATGAVRWRADLGGAASAPPAAIEGRILVPLTSGALVCFEEGEE